MSYMRTKKCNKWVLAFTLAFTPLLAQSNDPPGTIDGAVNPDLIPDVVAFRLFLGALAEGPGTSAAQPAGSPSSPLTPTAKQNAKLLPSALNSADMSALLQALNTWQASITPPAWPPAAPVDLDAVTQTAMGVLQQQMSPSGFDSLLAQVRSEKKNMKRIPVSNMAN